MGKIYGYARVSTKNQRLDRQIRNIEDYCKDKKIERIYREKYTVKGNAGRLHTLAPINNIKSRVVYQYAKNTNFLPFVIREGANTQYVV